MSYWSSLPDVEPRVKRRRALLGIVTPILVLFDVSMRLARYTRNDAWINGIDLMIGAFALVILIRSGAIWWRLHGDR